MKEETTITIEKKPRYEDTLDECEKCDCVAHYSAMFPAAIACYHPYFQNLNVQKAIPIQYSKAPPWCPKKFKDEKDWNEHGRKL